MKVVFDTSVFISAFAIPGSLAENVFLAAVKGRIELFSSPAILTETANKLQEKFGVSEEEAIMVLRQINKSAQIIKPKIKLDILADEPDNRILECAVTAKVDLIVTGDKKILKLKNHDGIGICRVADLLHSIND